MMEKLISPEQARDICSTTDGRRDQLITLQNAEIIKRASNGARWAYLVLPLDATILERDWLSEMLVLNGFKVQDKVPQIKW